MISDRFFLKGADAPYITALKFVSIHQYEVLLYVRDNPDTSYKKGAKELGIPIGTFKTRLHRARQKIKNWREAQLHSPAGQDNGL